MLNIKNKETYKLAKELAKITGDSMTVAVTEALKEKLNFEKTKSYKSKHKIADEIIKIAQRISNNQPTNQKNTEEK